MKVALIGNMNNNNFSILRYLRDLGVDAHLLLFRNDGTGSLKHFAVENDTWNIDKWKPFIHRLDLDNGVTSLIPYKNTYKTISERERLFNLLKEYDYLIGSGISPALCDKFGLKLDIFYPYATLVEFVGTFPNSRMPKYISGLLRWYVKYKQIKGLKNTKNVLIPDNGQGKEILSQFGVESKLLHIPMVYNGEKLNNIQIPNYLEDILNEFEEADINIFSHARHLWINKEKRPDIEWDSINKNNNWLIEALNVLKKSNPEIKIRLYLAKYGPDINETIELINKYGLVENIVWFSKLKRRELIYLISKSDICVGEFVVKKGATWGGTLWEILSVGKPALQTLNFDSEDYLDLFGHEVPPILDVKDHLDIVNHLKEFHNDKKKFIQLGNEAKNWFDKNNGKNLVLKWLEVLKKR